MPHPPDYIPPGSLVEVSARTVGDAAVLRPDAALDARILGVLGRALATHDVAMHGFVFLPSEWTALLTVADARQLSRFLAVVHTNVARAVHDVHGFPYPVFQARRPIVPIVDHTAAADRFHALLERGVVDGLVASPLDWPGLTSARALIGTETLVGVWQDRCRDAHHVRRGSIEYSIPLTPLPAWRGLPPDEQRKRVRLVILAIQASARARDTPVAGAAAIRALDPRAPFAPGPRPPRPIVYASYDATRTAYLDARTAFLARPRHGAPPAAGHRIAPGHGSALRAVNPM